MTKKDALTLALSTMADDTDAKTVIKAMIAQLEQKRTRTPEQKEAANAARRAKTAAARAELVAKVAPILREGLSHTLHGVTAKELYQMVEDKLPEDFYSVKVQNVLLREMRDELDIIETKGKANTYRLKEGA